MSSVTGTALKFTSNGEMPRSSQRREAALREAVREVVGTTFLGEMLKIARSSPLKTELFHGGRGEEIFRSQLDAELARRAGGAMQNGLADEMYKRLSRGT